MRRLAVIALVAGLALPARSDPQLDSAIRALRKDPSLKVRTQAAIVLGHRGAREAVQPLREAVAEDSSSAVRIAAVAALARIGDRAARSTLKHARDVDPDEAVRREAGRALADIGPLALAIEEPSGPPPARAALREALSRHLADRGLSVSDDGELRLKPTVLLEVSAQGGRTVIAVRTSLLLVDADGRIDMLESTARAFVAGEVPDRKVPAYSTRAIEAAARALSEDLAALLAER
jgi:HEAT repeat protein